MTNYAHITGWGMAVPERIMTNDDLAQIVDTNDEWIRDRTGIRERRVASATETTASLAVEASLRALDVANIDPRIWILLSLLHQHPNVFFRLQRVPFRICLVQQIAVPLICPPPALVLFMQFHWHPNPSNQVQ